MSVSFNSRRLAGSVASRPLLHRYSTEVSMVVDVSGRQEDVMEAVTGLDVSPESIEA